MRDYDEQEGGEIPQKLEEKETEESGIHKIDKEENRDLDNSSELVIDEGVVESAKNRKSVTFSLEEKSADGTENNMEQEEIQETGKDNDSSDTIPVEDIKLGIGDQGDEFDSEDDIPFTQNIHRPRYVKSAKEEEDRLFSNSNAEPERRWGKLKTGDKLKGK